MKQALKKTNAVVLGCVILFFFSSCSSLSNFFPGSEAYGTLDVTGMSMVCIDEIIVQRNLEATTVSQQFSKVVPFLLEDRGWKVVTLGTEECYHIIFLLQEFESFKNFTATKVVQAEMTVYEKGSDVPVFMARVWTDGQSSMLEEPLLRRLARMLIKQLPKVKSSEK